MVHAVFVTLARMQDNRPLAGKVAFVTGAARRIGRAIVLDLAAAGAAVTFTYRESGGAARELEKQLRQAAAAILAVEADVRQHQSVGNALARTVERFGRLDIVVNNAGKYEDVAFEAMSEQQWDDMLDTNLKGPFLVSRYAVPLLRRAGGGRIINIASIGAIRAFPTHAHYCASKAGLAHLTRAMARALAPEIQVNAVAPGLICTGPQLSKWEQRMCERTPLRRAGTVADVAAAVRFLATCNPFITGEMLAVDGGLSLV